MSYRIVRREATFPQHGRLWNPEMITETMYSVEGPGISRPANDIEIAIWRQVIARAIEIVKPYEKHVNVSDFGGTPEEALRKEFGL